MNLWHWLFPPRPAPTPPGPVPTSDDLFAAVNVARSARGKPPFAVDVELIESAQGWADHLAITGVFSHDGGRWAQALALGQRTPADAVAAWIGDLPHRLIVLGDYATAGCGVARKRDGSIVWVLDCR